VREGKYWIIFLERRIESEKAELKIMVSLYKKRLHGITNDELLVQNLKTGLMCGDEMCHKVKKIRGKDEG